MRTKIWLPLIVILIIAACSKDNFQSKPTLKFKQASTNELQRNESIRFTLELTDAEGDIEDSIWVQEVVRNCPSAGFTTKYKMPEITATKDLKGEVELCFSYGINIGCPVIQATCPNNANDSATFRFWIRDAGSHVSDTVSSSEIVIVQQ